MSTHIHHSPTRALRKLGRAIKSRNTTMDRVDNARSKQAHAEQVQFVRSFRM